MKKIIFCFGALFSVILSATSSAETKVFLLAGQSNMVGLGGYIGYKCGDGKPWNEPPYDHADVPCPAPFDKPQTDVKFWNYGVKPGDDHANVLKAGDGWIDLRPGFGSRDDEFGPEVSFGYHIKKLFPKDDIYLIKSATGGTNLAANWDPQPDSMGPQYKLFKLRTDAALKNLADAGKKPKIIGMIWMQGEDDSTNEAYAKAYGDNLKKFIAKVRSDYKTPEMKFVVGRITTMTVPAGWATPANCDLVRTAQQKVPEADGNAAWFDTDDLKWAFYGHYGTEGQLKLGERFAEKFAPPKKTGNEKKK